MKLPILRFVWHNKSMRTLLLLLAALGAAVAYVASGPHLLKLRVAKELLGWDGLFHTAKETVALRLLGSRQTESRTQLHALLDLVRRTDLEYCVPTRRVVDAEDIAECHRFITHLVRTALKLFYELDLADPHFEPMVEPRVKVLGDNPDALYFTATFAPEHDYLVEGRPEDGEAYTSFTVYEQLCVGCFVGRPVSALNNLELIREADGESFRILVSRKNSSAGEYANFMSLDALKPGSFPQLVSRHYFESEHLRAQLNQSIRPRLRITRLTPLDHTIVSKDEQSAKAFEYASNFVRAHALEMLADPAKAPSWFSFTPNRFGQAQRFKDEAMGAGAADIVYSAGPFKFADVDNEGLLIVGVMPECAFANIALWNRLLQTFAYEKGRTVSLNRKQLGAMEKGSKYSILLSKRLPKSGLPQGTVWLDSEGRTDGQMFWRFLLVPDGDEVETPQTRLIKNVDLIGVE